MSRFINRVEADEREHVTPGDPLHLMQATLHWWLRFDFGAPHSVRESNIAVEAFKDGYRAALTGSAQTHTAKNQRRNEMSQIIIEDAGMAAIMADPKLAAARRKLSFHEICLIMRHARGADGENWRERAGAYERIITELQTELDATNGETK